MRTLGQLLLTFLFNASWQILLIVAAALLCDRLLRGTTAWYRHALWVAALFLSLFLPLLSASANFPKSQAPANQPVQSFEPQPVVVTRISTIEGQPVEPAEPIASISPAQNEPAPRSALTPVRLTPVLAAVLLGLYGLSVLYSSLRFFRAWLQTRRIIRSAFPFEIPRSVRDVVRECEQKIGTGGVRILCSKSVPVPITVGVLRPRIILPHPFLNEIEDDVLISAIGHELVHIARRDYLANLIYEFIYVPIWFHPAASLIRRRIRHTRELCCDEWVASKLLRPEIYARSLVRLIGLTPLTPRLAADTTIGITESENLEVRIMALLKTRRLSSRRKVVLLLIATLLLAAPCIAATSFAVSLEINGQDPVASQEARKAELERHEQVRVELQQKAQELRELEKRATSAGRTEIQARILEVQRALEVHEKLMEQFRQQNPGYQAEFQARLREVQQNLDEHARILQKYQQQGANQDQIREAQKRLAELVSKYPDLRSIDDAKKLLEQYQPVVGQQTNNRRPKVIHRVEPEYTADAREKKIRGMVLLTMVVDREGNPQDIKVAQSLYPSLDQAAIEAAKKMRFEPALKDGQPVAEKLLVEFNFQVGANHFEIIGSGEGAGQGVGYAGGVREMRRRNDGDTSGQDDRARRQAELAQGAVISMDRAIQIATSKYPGKVIACSLGRDKDGPVFYHLVMINSEGDKRTVKYVWISAVDGTIIKAEDETRSSISGGALNGKAISLPQPEYPAIARAARASGTVKVEVTVNEQGDVVSAHPISGHPLLQGAATNAARKAKFSPTYLQGQPVTVKGHLSYNFVAQ